MNLNAVRNAKGNYSLRLDGEHFGTLFVNRHGVVTGMSFRDEELTGMTRRLAMNWYEGQDTNTVRVALAIVRRALEIQAQDEWEYAQEELAAEQARWAAEERLNERGFLAGGYDSLSDF